MTTIEEQEHLIKENIPISRCKEGDKIYLRFGQHPGKYGSIVITKIKPVLKDRVQIKFRDSWNYTGKPKKVHKLTLPASFTVERNRKWVESDGKGTGFWQKKPKPVPILTDQQISIREAILRDAEMQGNTPYKFEAVKYRSLVSGLGISLIGSDFRLVPMPSPYPVDD